MRRVVAVAVLHGRPACWIEMADRADEGSMWTEIERLDWTPEAHDEGLPDKMMKELLRKRLMFKRRERISYADETLLGKCGFVTSEIEGVRMMRTPRMTGDLLEAKKDLVDLICRGR